MNRVFNVSIIQKIYTVHPVNLHTSNYYITLNKDYKIGICCFSTKNAAFIRRNKHKIRCTEHDRVFQSSKTYTT